MSQLSPSRSLTLLGSLVLVVFAVGCKGGHGSGKDNDAGGNADGGTAISVKVNITGDGEVDIDGTSACTNATTPCSLNVTLGGSTTVEAKPALGWEFTKWECGGLVSTTATLGLALSSGITCTVTFTQIGDALSVTVTDGSGGTGGTVTSSSGGIQCGTSATPMVCGAVFNEGSSVTLTAAADPFYTFTGWSGDCTGTDPTATVTINKAATACTATFARVQFPLTISIVGNGSVDESTTTASIGTCNQADCTVVNVNAPSVVTLTATPAANNRLISWTGDCTGDVSATPATATVTMDMARACVITFGPLDRGLTTTTIGNGVGIVAKDPLGTANGASSTYPDGTVVTLTATADTNSDFGGWGGDCAGTDTTTTVTISGGDKNCTALFTLKQRTLTVTASAHGVVTSAPAGIDTSASMTTAAYDHGTNVQLTATPQANYAATFGGDCSSTGAVTMDANKACTVTFALVKETLTVTAIGSGSVTSSPVGIDTKTGATTKDYDYGTVVTLTEAVNTGGATSITFVGWGGSCASAGTSKTAMVTMDAIKTCTATFTVTPYNLGVSAAPTTGGNITGTINGTGSNVINCVNSAGDCSEAAIPSDKFVRLVAAPASGYRFVAWSNCSTATTTTVDVQMTNDKTCVANFVKQWSVTVTTLTGPGTVTIDRSSTGVGADQTCSAGNCSQLVDGNETTTVKALPGTNAIVEAFTCSAGTKSGSDTYTITNPTANVTCTVTFHQQYSVAVSVAGAGGGSVTSAPSGINACTSANGTCTAPFLSGALVTLTATPSANYQVAWSAATGGTCDGTVSNGTGQAKIMTFASLDGIKFCQVSFTAITVTVNGKSAGNGTIMIPTSKTVTSGGTGAAFTALPSANYQVASWSGAFTSGSGTPSGCGGSATTVTVTISGAAPGSVYDCTATFSVIQVTVNGKVSGSGTATPTTQKIDSGGTAATITAAPMGSNHLTGWSGGITAGSGTVTPGSCSGAGSTTTVGVSGAAVGTVYDCTATFAANVLSVAGVVSPLGTTTVTASPTTTTAGGAVVTVTRGSPANFRFVGWSGSVTSGTATIAPGSCSGNGLTTTVSATATSDGAVYTCVATFIAQHTLTINLVAEGEDFSSVKGPGSVGGSFSCSQSSCPFTFDDNASISLTAAALIDKTSPAFADFAFDDWTGCVSTTSATASLTNVVTDIICTAEFHRYFARSIGTETFDAGTNGWIGLQDDQLSGLLVTANDHFVSVLKAYEPGKGPPNNPALSSYILRLPAWGDLAYGAIYSYEASTSKIPAFVVDLIDVVRSKAEGHAILTQGNKNFGAGTQNSPIFAIEANSSPGAGSSPASTIAYVVKQHLTDAIPTQAWISMGTFGDIAQNGYALLGTFLDPAFSARTMGRVIGLNTDGGVAFDTLFCQPADASCKNGCGYATTPIALDGGSDGKLLVIGGNSKPSVDVSAGFVAYLQNGVFRSFLDLVPAAGGEYSNLKIFDVAMDSDDVGAVILGSVTSKKSGHALPFVAHVPDPASPDLDWSVVYDSTAVGGRWEPHDIDRRGTGYVIAGVALVNASVGDEGFYLTIAADGGPKSLTVYGSTVTESNQNEGFNDVAVMANGDIALGGYAESLGRSFDGSHTENNEQDAWALRVRNSGDINFNATAKAPAVTAQYKQLPVDAAKDPIIASTFYKCGSAMLAAEDKNYDAQEVKIALKGNKLSSAQQASQCGPVNDDTTY